MTDDLNLPIVRGMKKRSKVLSMDEYLEFVMFNLKNNFDREAYRERRRKMAVNVPFVL